jgi:chemotaxis protein MotC
MIRRGLIRAALFFLLPLSFAGSRAEEAAPQPYQLVRTLQLLQDQIAHGSLEAHGAQLTLLSHLGDQFLKADPTLWRDPRNARAAAVYLLSGGQPVVVRTLLGRKSLDADDKLLLGALAYVEGREGEASALLRGIDARILPVSIGGQLALVQSALTVRQDLKVALQHLDDARLLMPGTLVDEAALRREIFVAGQFDDFDKFEWLAQQYIRRYRDSIYAGNFRQRFALALTRFSFAQDPRNFPRLVNILNHLDAPSRRMFYLLIARTALVRGKSQMAQLAAEQALALAENGTAEKERARLYRGASRLLTESYEAGVAELGDIPKAQLAPRDIDLLDAAQTLARTMRKPLPEVRPATEGSGDAAPPTPARLDVRRADETLARARRSLGEIDQLLKEKAP